MRTLFILFIIFIVTTFRFNICLAQSQIFSLLNINHLGWGKFTLTSSINTDNIISKHIKLNQKAKGFPGYRIQVFFASGTDAKNQANKLKTELRDSFSDYNVYVLYEEPFFKVKIGDFRNKIEAYKLFKQIQEYYPSAFIVEDLISFPNL